MNINIFYCLILLSNLVIALSFSLMQEKNMRWVFWFFLQILLFSAQYKTYLVGSLLFLIGAFLIQLFVFFNRGDDEMFVNQILFSNVKKRKIIKLGILMFLLIFSFVASFFIGRTLVPNKDVNVEFLNFSNLFSSDTNGFLVITMITIILLASFGVLTLIKNSYGEKK